MIALDARYPEIIKSAEAAISITIPDVTTRRYFPKDNSVRVLAPSSTWRDAFPQHGRGHKHPRTIELVSWQRSITHRFPAACSVV